MQNTQVSNARHAGKQKKSRENEMQYVRISLSLLML